MGISGGLGAISWASPLDPFIPRKDLPQGWSLVQGPQSFTPKTLFEHIDGQADLFIQYGFRGSVFAIYQHRERTRHQIEVDIFDMGNTIQAFGIFSRFRNEDRPGGFGLDSYLDGQSAFFYKGRFFALLHATESDIDGLTQFSRLIASKITDPSPPPREIGFFPKDGLKPASIQYFPAGLMGKQFLKRGFRGNYLDGEKESSLFLGLYKDSREAAKALKLFQEDLSKRGKISPEKVTPFILHAFKGEDPYQGKVIVLQKKNFLLGVIGFEKEEEAMARLKKVLEKIG